MDKTIRTPFLGPHSDNRKSKTCPEPFDSAQDKLRRSIQNLKWVGFLAILVLLVVCVGMAEAQQAKKVPRIGLLTTGFPASIAPLLEGFKQGLRELGYVEGQNVLLELRYGEAKAEQLPILKQVVEIAEKNRLPAMYPLADYVNAGGLMSYGVINLDLFRRAATYVDKILKGAKPADLPVEQPTKFELVINLKTAKQIGLTIPQSVLYRADKVIK